MIATNGTPRQILAKITDQRAFQVSPRKSILVAISPSFRSDQDTIENWLSKIHQNAMAESTVGTMKGISTTRADDRLERHVLVEQQREIEADREFERRWRRRYRAAC